MSRAEPRGIPLTVVGGFLGAGKTTLLNRLLGQSDRRIAVLVNDFGSVEIDAELVRDRDSDTISLTNGCVCCGLSGELMFALAGLRDREDPPEHVVVEASGVGDPLAIVRYAEVPGFRRDAIVVVADAETVRDRAGDPRIGERVAGPLRSSHLIVLSKTDLVSPDALAEVRAWLRQIAPLAGIVEAVRGDVPADVLLGAHDRAQAPPAPAVARPAEAEHPPDHDHAADYATWSWSGTGALDGHALAAALPELPQGVLRVKGFLHLREDPEHRYLLQLAGRRWSIARDRAWRDDEERASRLVAIGFPEAIRPDELVALVARLGGA